jgi:catecholate siderophore receptor
MRAWTFRHRASLLLATTFIVSTASLRLAAMANDEPPQRPRAAKADKLLSHEARDAHAQTIELRTINIEGKKKRVRPRTVPAAAPAARLPPSNTPVPPALMTNAGGDIGYHANSTSTATKTNTPLRDIPQSITVITKQQVQDIGAQRIEDVVRYVPGVNWHQGEGNRDQIVIRGQSSTADFFVNGMRDDAQIYRDLYNTERLEFLKGPNAMIFGRGGSGGVLNRVLKEADGVPINEWKVQTGSFNNARVATDIGNKITDTLYGRINAVFEDTDSYRDFWHMQRGGVNPSLTWLATPLTKVKVSYEYFHDDRTADRGIPSFNGVPFPLAAPNQFFGNPFLSHAPATQNVAMGVVEHDFNNGLTVKNQTRFADYKRFYQNVYPGSAVSNALTYTEAAYNNRNDRQNLINQTDWSYKFYTDIWKHTLAFGTEFGNQQSANARFSGFFDNNTTTSPAISALNPTSFQNVRFLGLATDARNRTDLNTSAVYVQDQIEFTRWLQFIGGVRFERFDLDYVNLNAQAPATFGQRFSQINNLVSPRAGLVVKPVDPVSLYASYSVSYLPASGDQFGALTPVSSALKPEQFTNKELGAKWDIMPLLTFTAALFQLDRENTPIRDPAGTGTVVAAGHSRVTGFEAGLAGYVTDQWQISVGYANLHAVFVSDTSNAAGTLAARAGAHVPFVPNNTWSVWNRYDITYNWGVGVGVIGQDEYFAAVDNTVRVPGFTRVDGAVFWRLNKFVRAQVNVENIFGAKYYPSADANNNITIGSPRAFRFTLTTNFTGDDRSAPLWGPGLPTMFRPTSSGPAGPGGFGGPPGTY